jgi:hypothetical protein
VRPSELNRSIARYNYGHDFMRMKIAIGLLVFAVLVLLSGYTYVSASIGRRLSPSEFARFSSTIAKSLMHPHEGGASRAFSLSKQALSSAPSAGSIEVNGQSYVFPLPKYAVPQDKGACQFHFLAFVSPAEMQNYFYRDLPQAGWKQVAQMGGGHFLEGHGSHMTIVQYFYLTSDISDFDVMINDCP